MKRITLFLAAAALVVSCKNLADNEFEITGEVDASLDGKNVILEKQGPMGFMPVDTVKIEGGKFVFKDTTSAPSINFISLEGKQDKLNFILEPGAIEIKMDKDTLFKSKVGGTFNNEKLEEFKQIGFKMYQKTQKFQKENNEKRSQALQANDTVTANRIGKEYRKITEEWEGELVNFMKKNPKAYCNVIVLGQVAQMQIKPMEEIKKLFDALDPEVKNSKEGKQIGEYFVEYEKQKNATPQPQETESTPAVGVKVGDIAPDFSAPTPDGKTLSLKQAMGKVTIIDFWASWCKPCRAENPNVVALYNELHGKGLNIIGVSLDKEAAAWKKAIADDKLTWNHISNLKFWDDAIAKQYGVQGIPATFILDASGKVIAKDLRGAELKAKVQELLK
ncbi:redoxin domain-containing protein [Flavobacterium sp. Sd200]|uniref:TlpA disulfide reductase family protein n=1 Tax=Flavobacterium sp. Sd200 TaxID=2692211 RepID=UPI00136A3E59|nr:TlpA disulfide reductase family protein [Flavobacterium sp. Sd200]MXN90560.1 redoxin domain-containing protein [Flavobacterium sp. Sd200]